MYFFVRTIRLKVANHKNNKNIDAQITQGDIIGTNKISIVTIQENGITIQKQSKTTPLHSIFKSSYSRSRERKKNVTLQNTKSNGSNENRIFFCFCINLFL